MTEREIVWGLVAFIGLVLLIGLEWIPGVLFFAIGAVGLAASDFES